MSGIWGALNEAWQELRIHRTRVLLSLIGVAVAVAAITATVGLGSIARQAQMEVQEAQSGRPATIVFWASRTDGQAIEADRLREAFMAVAERYSIEYASMDYMMQQQVQLPDGALMVESRAVEPIFGEMHRVQTVEGEWFTEAHAAMLAPAVIINEVLWERLGSPDLRTHPTLELLGGTDRVAVITGVVRAEPWQREMNTGYLYMLADDYRSIVDPAMLANVYPNLEVWVPDDQAQAVQDVVVRDLRAALGENATVDAGRNDWGAWPQDPFLIMQLFVAGVAALVLLLGALGLVNISLVTLRQRIREIGIRRSFGATSGRVFFAVLLESVVGTIAAGAAGVVLAILIVRNDWLLGMMGIGSVDAPAFPVEAAVLGMACAVGTGAVAGLLPALFAMRVKVIDAIRF